MAVTQEHYRLVRVRVRVWLLPRGTAAWVRVRVRVRITLRVRFRVRVRLRVRLRLRVSLRRRLPCQLLMRGRVEELLTW